MVMLDLEEYVGGDRFPIAALIRQEPVLRLLIDVGGFLIIGGFGNSSRT